MLKANKLKALKMQSGPLCARTMSSFQCLKSESQMALSNRTIVTMDLITVPQATRFAVSPWQSTCQLTERNWTYTNLILWLQPLPRVFSRKRVLIIVLIKIRPRLKKFTNPSSKRKPLKVITTKMVELELCKVPHPTKCPPCQPSQSLLQRVRKKLWHLSKWNPRII